MPKAYVLMTAMPPTVGHLHLIQFAAALGDTAEVIVCTQPDEPFVWERLTAIRVATQGMNVNIHHIHKALPQEPEGHEGFWDMWDDFLKTNGMLPGDYIVASEPYGKKLAEVSGGVFMPYDIQRLTSPIRATLVRHDPRAYFDQILPEFRPFLQQRVTIFGAESTGKTTLAMDLSKVAGGYFLPEWARPYLETMGPELDEKVMTRIWHGQRALQDQAELLRDKPFIFQDTDLFSTIGYWDLYWKAPDALIWDACRLKSDLYIITASNIPFVPDQLRYGVDHRESTDQYWIDICEKYNLNYIYLQDAKMTDRVINMTRLLHEGYDAKFRFTYERVGA